MRTKSEILARLEELKNDRADVDELFAPVIAKIEKYFVGDSQLTHDVQYTLHQLAQDIMNRKTIYENQSRMPSFPTNYPKGYEDVRDLFVGGGAFEEIMAVSIEDFEAAYVYEPPEDEGGGGEESAGTGGDGGSGENLPPSSNTLLDAWLGMVGAAREGELSGLGAIAGFCEGGGYNGGLAMLFEELGEVISSIGKPELAKRIYVSGGYREVIETFGLNVYIASTELLQ
ncbi:MAG: hypothetical protein IJ741_03625 [Schwartzia sp.]|nr:hypothetical protein [Schwartzia sp. (in: firmicutes)]